jgi:hypothetical protein
MALMLPYTRWLDWCEVAYFVAERDAASSRMRAVLHALARVPAREAQAKQAALRRAWPAFAFREGAAGAAEGRSAPDFLTGEACAAARRFARATPAVPVRRDLIPCTLQPPGQSTEKRGSKKAVARLATDFDAFVP